MTNKVITTNINLEDNAKVIKSLDSKIAELKELRDEKIAEVREVMEKANVMELRAGAFTFSLKEITRTSAIFSSRSSFNSAILLSRDLITLALSSKLMFVVITLFFIIVAPYYYVYCQCASACRHILTFYFLVGSPF